MLDVPLPEIAPDQALVRVTHCGICGSDLRYLHGDNPWAKQTLGEQHPNPRNIILGHEVSGVVERLGENCDASLDGRRVAVLAFGVCGECYFCKRGDEHLCPNTQHLGHGAGWGTAEYYYGGMAEYLPAPARWLQLLPDDVSNEAACLLDPLGVAVHGVKTAGVSAGDTVLVIGAGAVGALAIQVARQSGAAEVLVADVCDEVLHIARKLGASHAVNPLREQVSTAVMHASRRVGARVILDTVGARLEQYLPMLARGGSYVTMTVTDKPEAFPTVLLAGERSLRSSCNFRFSDYAEAMALLGRRRIDTGAIITHRYSLADALEAFRVAEDKATTGAVKVVLTG